MRNQVFLTKNPEKYNYSIESGVADNVCHFDHHKPEHRGFPCPGNNPAIPSVSGGAIAISHLDCDTFLGLLRFEGIPIPENLNLDIIEHVDLNGSLGIDRADPSYLYLVGISALARKVSFPRLNGDLDIDVTEYVDKMISFSPEEIIQLGAEDEALVEEGFVKAFRNKEKGIGLFLVERGISFDPSLSYEKGLQVVVVYRPHYQTISLYSHPTEGPVVLGTWAEISFGGHPRACGSPRGEIFQFEDAHRVWAELVKAL
jgi:hypothetical protein